LRKRRRVSFDVKLVLHGTRTRLFQSRATSPAELDIAAINKKAALISQDGLGF
jgi:hypothetical protein